MTGRALARQLWHHGIFQIATGAIAVIVAGLLVLVVH